ncbi:MAG: hypothetical protein GY761_21445 [Hyphomicrobiales bacterium]|nr:hypothetical protein [Hyphomicrobiales bacterium]
MLLQKTHKPIRPIQISVIWLAAIVILGLACNAQAERCVQRYIQTELIDAEMQYCVSSTLPSQGVGSYGPENLLGSDDKSAGAWCEGVNGTGKGEWVEQKIRSGIPIRSIYVSNGYQKSVSTFSANGRVRHVRIATSNGTTINTELRDIQGDQRIKLPGWEDIESIRMTIISTYPGSKYKDTCISGMTADFEEMREIEFKRMNQ